MLEFVERAVGQFVQAPRHRFTRCRGERYVKSLGPNAVAQVVKRERGPTPGALAGRLRLRAARGPREAPEFADQPVRLLCSSS
jgi:hypothetical protein